MSPGARRRPWADLADEASVAGIGSVTERDVVPDCDPAADLARRTRRWSHELPSHGLADLCRFAAGLAEVEAASWENADPIVATRAHEDRRFFLSDRLIHWAVPVLLATGLDPVPALDVGDRLRLAPAEGVGEGLQLPGHDAYGPADEPRGLQERRTTLWGGWVPSPDVDVAGFYGSAADTWLELAERHPGTAGLWSALAARAATTSRLAG